MKYTEKYLKKNFKEIDIENIFSPHEHIFFHCIPRLEKDIMRSRLFLDNIKERVSYCKKFDDKNLYN